MKRFVFMLLSALLYHQADALSKDSVLAFPGAEGFGKFTSGGRGGRVYMVTNLNDAGPGSLREGIKQKGPRTIVFALSGTIALESPLVIKNGDLTIAGQSAPGDGICLKNYTTTVDADNVIVRFMRFRMGDERKHPDDSFNGKGHHHIIIDHCSMSWSIDETASFYWNRNFTMQWCIIAESLENSFHPKGPHGYGGIWGGEGATFHHNLLASHTSRNPRFSGSETVPNKPDELVDFVNNVIFNWGSNSTYGGERGRYNMVNNYYKAGPATVKTYNRIVNPWMPLGQYYINGNILAGNAKITSDNWLGAQGEKGASVAAAKIDAPLPVVNIATQNAADAYQSVLQKAGANLHRDEVDLRILKDVVSGKPTEGSDHDGIIDSQKDVGGWPELKTLPTPADQDQDGIPDDWEKQHGLNPANSADAAGYNLDKQYTNLEVYLNSLVKDVI
ncbi:pectate lyase [Mucilaginibacter sp. RS28]|uniref:Pectate lyase n=1 Tax=Mucilaginibacter straminoryzae TaxID=2932774 RepID=A0A9X1X5A6_9SPHI|nr:pectate lyase [Mucilaginibacter straminoryzae]MCJ8210831.1 pectate lyase [Mucilaginibacter straminoryzae]